MCDLQQAARGFAAAPPAASPFATYGGAGRSGAAPPSGSATYTGAGAATSLRAPQVAAGARPTTAPSSSSSGPLVPGSPARGGPSRTTADATGFGIAAILANLRTQLKSHGAKYVHVAAVFLLCAARTRVPFSHVARAFCLHMCVFFAVAFSVSDASSASWTTTTQSL